jgi:hypothetical protein
MVDDVYMVVVVLFLHRDVKKKIRVRTTYTTTIDFDSQKISREQEV